jgi:DNA replication protein DnaC
MARTDCPFCQGSGWKIVEQATQGTQGLTAHGPSVKTGDSKILWATPCDCTLGDRIDRVLAKARVPERYRHCDFDNYETDNEIENASPEQLNAWHRSLAQAKLIVRRFAEEFSPVREIDSEHGLLLMGPCGVGKTHLAVSALKDVVSRGHRGLFYDYRELLKAIQDSYNPESQTTEMGVLEPVLQAELLVLDDVGSSKPSLWALETVGHILNTRYNEQRVTLLTTNFLDTDAVETAASPSARLAGGRTYPVDDSLTDRVGKRIRSRLYEMCRTVEIYAPDYRREIRNISRFRT